MTTIRWVTPTFAQGQRIPAPKLTGRRQWVGDVYKSYADRKQVNPGATSTPPKFSQNQTVMFSGGIGRILHHHPDAGTWTYMVEMELGPEPEVGRVGNETRILLDEADIQGVVA